MDIGATVRVLRVEPLAVPGGVDTAPAGGPLRPEPDGPGTPPAREPAGEPACSPG
ncbi:hypothetical protein [Pseudonocardia spirodelae]|uniref:Uncharacterized protein n=1 Tax=Pseudonocardia spirodelae TaxID=3133431 RepID=A0ABU8T237_9PSEU